MTKKNKKASWVEDVAFVFEECARIDALIVFRRGVWTLIGAGGTALTSMIFI